MKSTPKLFVTLILTLVVSEKVLAAEPVSSKSKGEPKSAAKKQAEVPKPDPVRDALNGIFEAASASWAVKDFAAVRRMRQSAGAGRRAAALP